LGEVASPKFSERSMLCPKIYGEMQLSNTKAVDYALVFLKKKRGGEEKKKKEKNSINKFKSFNYKIRFLE
jgi:hypothetical protein